jgi:hypothetical protein
MGVVMFKKISSGFMLSFLCFVQLSCCAIGNYKSSNDVFVGYLNHKFKKSKSLAINQNFIFLQKYVMSKDNNDFTQVCYENKHTSGECIDPMIPINSASGYVIDVDRKNNKIYALTAAHWCEKVTKDELYDSTELIFDDMPLINLYAAFMGTNYRISRYIMDSNTDICLVVFSTIYAKHAKKVNIAKADPVIGEKVLTISAPMWSYESEIRQHYEGKSSGCDDYECGFTIPTTYGSSGSAVINEKGEIVSIISRATIGFNNYAIGPKPEHIRKFLEDVYEKIGH